MRRCQHLSPKVLKPVSKSLPLEGMQVVVQPGVCPQEQEMG